MGRGELIDMEPDILWPCILDELFVWNMGSLESCSAVWIKCDWMASVLSTLSLPMYIMAAGLTAII